MILEPHDRITGLMLGCDIAPVCKFDRKSRSIGHAEELSDFACDLPLCTNGAVPLHDLAYPKDAPTIVTPDRK
jgi:aspartyl-tRNA(Asn)/glutamyl-tRNA(Gln) amidotransferase subunit B